MRKSRLKIGGRLDRYLLMLFGASILRQKRFRTWAGISLIIWQFV